jgi:DNA-binding response OmpR family regulator
MPRVLTVDDSRAIRFAITKRIKELGFEVEEAANGAEGLAKLQSGAVFDLVILDVTMPVMNGPDMLRQMRAAGNKTRVLMLTSEGSEGTREDVKTLGVEAYLLKPFALEDLDKSIKNAIAPMGRSSKAPSLAPPPPPA